MGDQPSGLGDFRALLQLQERDTAIDQLTYRRNHLDAQARVTDVQRRAVPLKHRLDTARAEHDELAERQLTLEVEIEAVEHRIAEINVRLYDGSAKIAPGDALAMSQEVKHLNDRKSHLEDDELEIMELLEPKATALTALEGEGHALADEMNEARAQVEAAQVEIDASLDTHRKSREEAAGQIPTALLNVYERLRSKATQPGSVVVAPLNGSSCGGCHLTLSATEVAATHKAPETEVVYCQECGRILVR